MRGKPPLLTVNYLKEINTFPSYVREVHKGFLSAGLNPVQCQSHGNFIVSQATSLGALCLNSIKKLLRILPHLFQLTCPHSIHREIILGEM